MSVYAARILGCGSSGGVPRADGNWGECDRNESKNYRLRCSLLVECAKTLEELDAGHATRIVIDTSPDYRQQMLAAGSPDIHGLVFTHTHADQAHGIDDVRAQVYSRGSKLDAAMSQATYNLLVSRFEYIFQAAHKSSYPALLDAQIIEQDQCFDFEGAGGDLKTRLFDVEHGREPCSGVRIGPIAYTPDVNGLDKTAFNALKGAKIWIVDALREKPHPSHSHLEQTLSWIKQVKPELSILTNLHVDMDYRTLNEKLPKPIRPAFDGLTIIYDDEMGQIQRIDPV